MCIYRYFCILCSVYSVLNVPATYCVFLLFWEGWVCILVLFFFFGGKVVGIFADRVKWGKYSLWGECFTLLTPTLCVTHSWLLHTFYFVLLPPSMHLHSRPLHFVHNTPVPCVLCIIYSWPLHPVCHVLLNPALAGLHISDTSTHCIAQPGYLQSVFIILNLTLTATLCVLYNPDICNLCIVLLTSVLCCTDSCIF